MLASVAGIVVLGMLSAYAFARMEFFGSTFLFYAIFGLLLIPSFLTLIPLFLEVKSMGLLNNPLALILPYIAGGQAFAIFVFRSSIRGIPEELLRPLESTAPATCWMLLANSRPCRRPIMIAVALLNVTVFWGDYVFPSLARGPTVDGSHGHRQFPATPGGAGHQSGKPPDRRLYHRFYTDDPAVYHFPEILHLGHGQRCREDVSPSQRPNSIHNS